MVHKLKKRLNIIVLYVKCEDCYSNMKSSSLFLCVILVLVNLTGCLSYEYAEDLWDESAYEIDYNDTREDVEYNNSENSWEKVVHIHILFLIIHEIILCILFLNDKMLSVC